jgi:hypothetical protein
MKRNQNNTQVFKNAEMLTREQLKNVFGGQEGESIPGEGDCQSHLQSCDTQKAINCCSKLKCAEFVCREATI